MIILWYELTKLILHCQVRYGHNVEQYDSSLGMDDAAAADYNKEFTIYNP